MNTLTPLDSSICLAAYDSVRLPYVTLTFLAVRVLRYPWELP